MNWEDAMAACAAMGDGWRLPTQGELSYMHIFKDEIGTLFNDYYWSSTEKDDLRARCFNMLEDDYHDWTKDNIYGVRAVRTMDPSKW